jgi:transcriptional regulator with XRE-family HTH domain
MNRTIVGLPIGVRTMRVPERDAASTVRAMTAAAELPEDERKARIAYVIRSTLASRGLNAARLARAVGRQRSTVGDWVAGRSTPSLVDLGPLCTALRLRPDAFVELPAIPEDPMRAYLLPAAESGIEEGLRRARQPRGGKALEPPVRLRTRLPRGNGAERG